MEKRLIKLDINNQVYEVAVTPMDLLLDVIRKEIGLTGTKKGCGQGDCGACTVIIDGKTQLSCLKLAIACEGMKITTIEGIAEEETGKLHPLQESFIDHGAVQCGFCTPGMILSSKALVDSNPKPTKDDVKHALAGNICRCTGYTLILEAVESYVNAKAASEGEV
ncbi:MAG TPA: (2Fe-2S)-binding protein [Anaerovoracaceae bacterium]|nr:(2Fe-2S)-binding protein [Anaerovoracaceae bacterium]